MAKNGFDPHEERQKHFDPVGVLAFLCVKLDLFQVDQSIFCHFEIESSRHQVSCRHERNLLRKYSK